MARSPFKRFLRLLGLAAHLIAGLAMVAIWYPLISPSHRDRLKACWSSRLLRLAGLQLRVEGALLPGHLQVANHVSWLDIFALNAACPTSFVAKAEMRQWPLIGWLAHRTDTLFIQRGHRRHAQHIAHQMSERLARGHSVAFFPEGTTTDGRELLPFHAALFQPAISAHASIQPIALRYVDARGEPSLAPAYIGEMSLMQSLRQTLHHRGLCVVISALPPLSPANDRRTLSQQAHEAIRTKLTDASHEPSAGTGIGAHRALRGA